VFLHVGLGGLVGVMSGVKSVPPCSMCMVGRFFVISALMVLSCFAVVTRGVRMVFFRLLMVLRCFLRQGGVSSVWVARWAWLSPAGAMGTPT
jgi:hypothetical protein